MNAINAAELGLTEAGAALAVSFVFMIIIMIVLIIALIPQGILSIVCGWNVFKKAGEPGWKTLIPVYGTFVAFRLFWSRGWFAAWVVTNAVSAVCSLVPTDTPETEMVMMIMALVISIFALFMSIRFTLMVARSFGRGGGFTAGLIFLPIVFFPMLAFGADRYIGPRGVGVNAEEVPQLPGEGGDSGAI